MMKKAMCIFAAAACAVGGLALTVSASGDVYEKIKAGKAMFQKKCKECHSLDQATDETMSRDDWEGTVNMMKGNGLEITDEERAKVVDYLAVESLFDTKCSVCHATSRPLSKSKDYEGWKKTVSRMAGKKPGHLSDAEIEEIASFLALERPAQ
jgi:mono/diheme cytochrome c family protein